MKTKIFLLITAFACSLATLFPVFADTISSAIDARMMRYPDVSATQIAFVYAGDIWIAPKTGGTAVRLSSPRGEEMFPRFSPDGSLLAFSGNYDGNIDVYVVPAGGGLPKRLTHHDAPDRVLGGYPDGQAILFGIYNTKGEWIIEGHGVDPEIQVVDDPGLMAGGGDPQLERAIDEVLKQLRKNPPTEVQKPKYPKRAGKS